MKYIPILIFSVCGVSSFAQTNQTRIDLPSLKSHSVSSQIEMSSELLVSAGLEEKIKAFQSQDLVQMDQHFQDGIERPIVLQGSLHVGGIIHQHEISFERKYLALGIFHNPVFPELELVQYRDDKLSWGQKFHYKKLQVRYSLSHISRKFNRYEYSVGDVLNNGVDFDPDGGRNTNFFQVNTDLIQEIAKDKWGKQFISAKVEKLDIGNNPLPEMNMGLGYFREWKLNELILQGGFGGNQMEDWEYGFGLSWLNLNYKYHSNNYLDQNYELSYTGKSWNIIYRDYIFRHLALGEKSSRVQSLQLAYSKYFE